MSNNRQLHYTQPGLRTQVVPIAPDAHEDIQPSKRYPLIDNEDRNLNRNLGELERGTKARNRAYQERLDDVWRSTAAWEGKLRVECQEAEESIVAMRNEYQNHITDFTQSLINEVNSSFNIIDDDLFPPLPSHLDTMDKNLDIFVDKTVPDMIEELVGQVSRKLKKEYEYFNIEQQKEEKREKKICNNASSHMQITAQRFTDEEALLSACFFNLEDDVMEAERRAARMYELKHTSCVKDVIKLKDAINNIREIRVTEDNDLLDTVIETQQLLQQTILEHFGMSVKQAGGIKFDKLDNRMARKHSRENNSNSRPASPRESMREAK